MTDQDRDRESPLLLLAEGSEALVEALGEASRTLRDTIIMLDALEQRFAEQSARFHYLAKIARNGFCPACLKPVVTATDRATIRH